LDVFSFLQREKQERKATRKGKDNERNRNGYAHKEKERHIQVPPASFPKEIKENMKNKK
jgi:hypothetical protein